MTREEFERRYKERIMEVMKIGPEFAQQCFDAVDYDDVVCDFEHDPEGAADDEMSYWSNDEGDTNDDG